MQTDVQRQVMAALEASIFRVPKAPGLTQEEIAGALRMLGLQPGEIDDAISDLARERKLVRGTDGIWAINAADYPFFLMMGGQKYDNYPVNPRALDFPVIYLKDLRKQVGRSAAKVDRSTLVAAGISKGIAENDMEVAITLLSYATVITIRDGIVSMDELKEMVPLYSAFLSDPTPKTHHPFLDKLIPLVSDIVDRRNDGRLASPDPLEAFTSSLSVLGYSNFSVWWFASYREYQITNATTNPKAFLLLSAALCEAMLCFVVEMAQQNNLSMGKGLDTDPKNWKLFKLVEAACTGQNPIIVDASLKTSLLKLNSHRQQIHAGALIGQYGRTAPVPDIRQEEAFFAKENTIKLARSIVDWIQKNK